MKSGLVSIVIANYNYAAYLAEAIESALGQTYQPVEVIVVDDGSTDASHEVIARYPVKAIAQKNQGLSGARNSGAAQAVGEFIMFLDSDDVLEANYVSRCLSVLQSAPRHIGYVYTHMQLFGTEQRTLESHPFDCKRLLLIDNFIHASALMRRSVFLEADGYDTGWRRAYEDYELWIRLLSLGYEGVLVPEPLLRYRKHGASMISLSKNQKAELQLRLRFRYRSMYLRQIWRRPHRLLRLLIWLVRARRMELGSTRSGMPSDPMKRFNI